MGDTLAILIFAAVCCFISWASAAFVMRRSNASNRLIKIVFCGMLPTVLLVFVLAIWEKIDRYQYDHGPTHDGYMGPMLFLIYGFPFVIGNLCLNIFFALWRGKPK